MIQYIPMDESHVSQVAELEKLCFNDPWSVNGIAYELTNPLSLWLVAAEADNVVGYVGSQSVMDEADMMNLAVDEKYRRMGIGKALVDQLVERLQERCVRSLTLEVRVSNQPAISLYESMGFLVVGRRPKYYQKPKEDALILRKEWQL